MEQYLSSITKQTMNWRNTGKHSFGATCLAVWWKARINKGHLLKMNNKVLFENLVGQKYVHQFPTSTLYFFTRTLCLPALLLLSINSGKKNMSRERHQLHELTCLHTWASICSSLQQELPGRWKIQEIVWSRGASLLANDGDSQTPKSLRNHVCFK